MRPKFTTGMKDVLFAILEEARKQWWWLVLALAFALMLWLAPKVKATPLDDYLLSHHLELPKVAQEEIKKQDLIAACGIEDTKNNIFTVYVLKKNDIPVAPLQVDISKAVMQVHFYLVKKRVIVEYTTCKDCPHAGKCWPNNRTEKVFIFLDFWHL